MNFVNFLKSRLIFNIFYCFWVFVNSVNNISRTHISKSKRGFDVKFSAYYFNTKTKILVDFQICISAPLNVRKTGWKKIRFQLALNKTFCPTPPPLSHWRFKHRQKYLTKQCFRPHRFSTQSWQYQYWKARKYFSLTVIELGPPVLESSTWSQQFMPPLIMNTNLIKRESKIGYP